MQPTTRTFIPILSQYMYIYIYITYNIHFYLGHVLT